MFQLQDTLSFENWSLFSPIKDNHESSFRKENINLKNVKNNEDCFLYTEAPTSTNCTAYLHSHPLNKEMFCSVTAKINVNLSFFAWNTVVSF